jgi:hypothetical protein
MGVGVRKRAAFAQGTNQLDPPRGVCPKDRHAEKPWQWGVGGVTMP